MHDTWMERLSEYLDETMDRAEREAIEAHVDECPTCAGVLGDLRKVRAKARQLDDAPAPHEEALWELRKARARKRDQLGPATIRTLESNLAIIDLAIDQAKRALVADSANTYVKEHLADTMRRKVELLQRATMLASTSGLEGSR